VLTHPDDYASYAVPVRRYRYLQSRRRRKCVKHSTANIGTTIVGKNAVGKRRRTDPVSHTSTWVVTKVTSISISAGNGKAIQDSCVGQVIITIVNNMIAVVAVVACRANVGTQDGHIVLPVSLGKLCLIFFDQALPIL
jgi:hypothetical protein